MKAIALAFCVAGLLAGAQAAADPATGARAGQRKGAPAEKRLEKIPLPPIADGLAPRAPALSGPSTTPPVPAENQGKARRAAYTIALAWARDAERVCPGLGVEPRMLWAIGQVSGVTEDEATRSGPFAEITRTIDEQRAQMGIQIFCDATIRAFGPAGALIGGLIEFR